MPTADEAKKLREETGISLQAAGAVLRRREKLERLVDIQNGVHQDTRHALHRLLTLLIEEEIGE